MSKAEIISKALVWAVFILSTSFVVGVFMGAFIKAGKGGDEYDN